MHMPKKLSVTLDSTSAFEVRTYLAETDEYAVALSSEDEVGVTWNPCPGRETGFPHTFSHQQWFILPEQLADMVLAGATFFDKQ